MGETARPDGLDDVSVVVGTYNERATIESVLADIDEAPEGRAKVVVVDSSIDGTAELAREPGATVVEQSPRGTASPWAKRCCRRRTRAGSRPTARTPIRWYGSRRSSN